MNQKISQSALMSKIYMASFAVNDITLFLDTHPEDKEALDYFNHYNEIRQKLLEEYENLYGPLTIDTAEPHEIWSWVMTSYPWEGGRNRVEL